MLFIGQEKRDRGVRMSGAIPYSYSCTGSTGAVWESGGHGWPLLVGPDSQPVRQGGAPGEGVPVL